MIAVAVVGAFSALFIASLNLFYNLGKIAARVESLESWRARVRDDMHEISANLGSIGLKLENLETLIRERTERRREPRE